jgi:ABC-2 type transport system permease protein
VSRVLRLTVLRVRRQFLDWSGGWWFTLTLVVNEALGPLVGLFVWSTVFPDDPRVVSYYVALIAVQMMTASYENHTFSETVYQGTVSHELLKPQPVVIGPIGENVAIRIWMSLFGLPLAALAGLGLGASYHWPHLLLAVPALTGAAVLRFLFTWILALTAFWTERVHAVVTFGGVLIVLLGGAAAPISLLPEPWHTIAATLPFHAMLGLPADIATGAIDGAATVAALGRGLAWILAFAALAVVVWRSGVRRYTVVGA